MANPKIKCIGKVKNIPVKGFDRKYTRGGMITPSGSEGKEEKGRIKIKKHVVTMPSFKKYTS